MAPPLSQSMTLAEIQATARNSELFCLDLESSKRMKELIKIAWQEGDSLGGVVEVVCEGLPVGLGSYTQWDRRLDGQLAQALMSIQAMKAVEVGDGFRSASLPGSEVHDAIFPQDSRLALPFQRKTNHAGGIEGGMTNGSRLCVRSYMKPIPTMRKGLDSVNFPGFQADKAHYERSDVCAIAAASVVCKAMVCLVLANALLDKFGGDSIADLEAAVGEYKIYCQSAPGTRIDEGHHPSNEREGAQTDREPEGNEDSVGEF